MYRMVTMSKISRVKRVGHQDQGVRTYWPEQLVIVDTPKWKTGE